MDTFPSAEIRYQARTLYHNLWTRDPRKEMYGEALSGLNAPHDATREELRGWLKELQVNAYAQDVQARANRLLELLNEEAGESRERTPLEAKRIPIREIPQDTIDLQRLRERLMQMGQYLEEETCGGNVLGKKPAATLVRSISTSQIPPEPAVPPPTFETVINDESSLDSFIRSISSLARRWLKTSTNSISTQQYA